MCVSCSKKLYKFENLKKKKKTTFKKKKKKCSYYIFRKLQNVRGDMYIPLQKPLCYTNVKYNSQHKL